MFEPTHVAIEMLGLTILANQARGQQVLEVKDLQHWPLSISATFPPITPAPDLRTAGSSVPTSNCYLITFVSFLQIQSPTNSTATGGVIPPTLATNWIQLGYQPGVLPGALGNFMSVTGGQATFNELLNSPVMVIIPPGSTPALNISFTAGINQTNVAFFRIHGYLLPAGKQSAFSGLTTIFTPSV